ncbi:MAG TPA: hypothetical protein PK036_16310, partial [Geobacteraceae bacterium]|nr:hypothetical protein [Geobacteraceae bacterium]
MTRQLRLMRRLRRLALRHLVRLSRIRNQGLIFNLAAQLLSDLHIDRIMRVRFPEIHRFQLNDLIILRGFFIGYSYRFTLHEYYL